MDIDCYGELFTMRVVSRGEWSFVGSCLLQITVLSCLSLEGVTQASCIEINSFIGSILHSIIHIMHISYSYLVCTCHIILT